MGRLRHAAALALIGWYLLMPPQAMEKWNAATKKYDPHISAPLFEWEILGSFDTAEECRTQQNSVVQAKAAGCPKCFVPECIATDDPRLKYR
jgi:hypothetical protein